MIIVVYNRRLRYAWDRLRERDPFVAELIRAMCRPLTQEDTDRYGEPTSGVII